MDALLAAADGRGESAEEGGGGGGVSWSIDESEAKELLQECLKRVLLLEEGMCVCVCVCVGVCVCVCMCVCVCVYRYI